MATCTFSPLKKNPRPRQRDVDLRDFATGFSSVPAEKRLTIPANLEESVAPFRVIKNPIRTILS